MDRVSTSRPSPTVNWYIRDTRRWDFAMTTPQTIPDETYYVAIAKVLDIDPGDLM